MNAKMTELVGIEEEEGNAITGLLIVLVLDAFLYMWLLKFIYYLLLLSIGTMTLMISIELSVKMFAYIKNPDENTRKGSMLLSWTVKTLKKSF